MPAEDKVRVEVAYQGGQSFTTLMSNEAAYMTGALIPISGGR